MKRCGAATLLLLFGIATGCAKVEAPKRAEPVVVPEAPALPNVYIEVNIPATEMTVYEDGVPKFVKPIAIGQGVYPTPALESSIKKIEWNPWWYPPPAAWAKDEKVTPPGPGNPLGQVKMALSEAILFHGTNKERSVGRPASHGCMRMFNQDAVEVAWYLQGLFSQQNDPALLEKYRRNRRTTFVVRLDAEVPVGLIYKPVVLRSDRLVFYPDYYRKLIRKDAAIAEEILASGARPECIDMEKVWALAREWPKERGTEIPVRSLLREEPACQVPLPTRTPPRALKGHPPSFAASIGKMTVNVLPSPTALSTVTRPPCSCAMCLTMASPRPVPPFARLRPLSMR